MKQITFFILFVLSVSVIQAQIKTPQPSPSSTIKQTVGLTEVTVDYSRPSMKGRTIFGDLVPFDQVWRTGANASTDITFSEDVTFGDVSVKAGTYALYTVPRHETWDVVLYGETDHWGVPKEYNKDAEVGVATVNVNKSAEPIESFTISVADLTNNGANLVLAWENTFVKVPIAVNTVSDVKKSIEQVMAGPSADDYFAAGRFYMEENMDPKQAAEWLNKAVDMRPDAFWMVKAQAEALANIGDYKGAIAAAKKSIALAQKAGNNQYIKMNEANIAKWANK